MPNETAPNVGLGRLYPDLPCALREQHCPGLVLDFDEHNSSALHKGNEGSWQGRSARARLQFVIVPGGWRALSKGFSTEQVSHHCTTKSRTVNSGARYRAKGGLK